MTDDDFDKPIVAIANSLHAVRARPRAPEGPRRDRRRRGWPRRAAWPASSTPSPSTTASPWATGGCSTACPAGRSSPTPSSTWSTPTAPTPSSASPTATRSRRACSSPPCGSTSPPSSSRAGRWRRARPSSSNGVVRAPTDLITAISRQRQPTRSPTRASSEVERSACPTCGSCSGMFTANSMNCLTEALGLSLPGNGSTLATHAARRALFEEAGRVVVDLARRYYEHDDESVAAPQHRHQGTPSRTPWPSTSPWAARPTPCCTSSPPRTRPSSTSPSPTSTPSAGGCRASARWRPTATSTWRTSTAPAASRPSSASSTAPGCCTATSTPCTPDAGEWLGAWDVRAPSPRPRRDRAVPRRPRRGPHHRAVLHRRTAGSRLDTDAEEGCIRDVAHAYTDDGGLAVLHGNIAADGCVVKTAGIDESLWSFRGPARVVESQEDGRRGASSARRSSPATSSSIRYEGPTGGPGMQEMLYPTAFLKGDGPRAEVRARHRRPLLRRHVGAVDRARLARGRPRAAPSASSRTAT